MSHFRAVVLLGCFCVWCCAPTLAAEDLGIRVPDGFEVSLYADDALAHDIYSMTVDAQGRVVVAGAGYVKILHDTDGDGRADRATLFSSAPASGAHGMVFDGSDLICSGDNSVMRLRDADGDGVADGAPEIWTRLRDPEHGANGLARGPDGCFYLICGNDSGISEKQITTATSPVKHPRCGGIVRFSSEGKPLDVFAHGFRNPYDLDFDAAGHLLTVDSDGERDHHLPWYAPTRLFDVAQGMEHGWLLSGWARGWNRPPSFFDNVERIVEIGRGSPTGLAAYRHRGFPEHYRGGVFSACWTLGRIYFFPLAPWGATCRGQLEVFMQTTGDVGFAPCDLAVGPSGDLFVAIGGRRTRGSVFRVHATGPSAGKPATDDPLAQVLTADQPLSSWSRAAWVPIARKLGKGAFEQAVENPMLGIASRVRAIEVLVEVFGGLEPALAEKVCQSDAPEIKARSAWALSREADVSSSQSSQILASLTADADPRVPRAAWESLAMSREVESALPVQPAWGAALNSPVRRIRAAAIAAARGAGQASYRAFLGGESQSIADVAAKPRQRLARLWIDQPDVAGEGHRSGFSSADFEDCWQVFSGAGRDTDLRLEAVRLIEIGLGDLRVKAGQAEVYTGYVAATAMPSAAPILQMIARQLAPAFPSENAELNRELARLLGVVSAESAGLLSALALRWTSQSSVEDDVHYLIVASLLPGVRGRETTAATAQALLQLHAKLEDLGQFPSRNWPFRVGEVFEELARRDPALVDAIVNHAAFGNADHTLFAEHTHGDARARATRKLWAAAVGNRREPTSELIALVGKLPAEEALPMLRSQWDNSALRDAIVLALSKYPREVDRAKFIEALSSPQPAIVEKAASALGNFGSGSSPSEIFAALRALKQACAAPKQDEPRKSLVRLLELWTEGNADVDETADPRDAYVPWFELFAQYYPEEAARLGSSSAADAATLKGRLAHLDWSGGDAGRGRAVFERRACHRCHQVSGHLGPELKGAVARMSREDLFTAIVDPNLEVSPAFQTTLIATSAGQVYHGVIVYESPESTLLQTGPDTTVRIVNAEQASVRRSTQSLMPTGLLETLSDRDLSDLYAYLKTLGSQ
jgi:putative membrane-bound dehydrogenase-like protein